MTIKSNTTPINGTLLLAPVAHSFGSSATPTIDSFTTTGIGSIIHRSGSSFVLQVTGDPVAATAWIVDLEGGLDGVNFDTILTHTTGTGNGKLESSGTMIVPIAYYRARVTGLTLGAAAKINISVMSKP